MRNMVKVRNHGNQALLLMHSLTRNILPGWESRLSKGNLIHVPLLLLCPFIYFGMSVTCCLTSVLAKVLIMINSSYVWSSKMTVVFVGGRRSCSLEVLYTAKNRFHREEVLLWCWRCWSVSRYIGSRVIKIFLRVSQFGCCIHVKSHILGLKSGKTSQIYIFWKQKPRKISTTVYQMHIVYTKYTHVHTPNILPTW